MLLPHALVLADARTQLAALADQATTVEASSAYEHVLIELDRVHDDECPTVRARCRIESRATLVATVAAGLAELERYGVDPLRVELLLAMLEDASALDGT